MTAKGGTGFKLEGFDFQRARPTVRARWPLCVQRMWSVYPSRWRKERIDARSWGSHISASTTIIRGRTCATSHASKVSSAADPTAARHGTPPVRGHERKMVTGENC